MKTFNVQCPLCKREIAPDASKCDLCGAILSPGPTPSTPILKGVICRKCQEKNYSYDICSKCGAPITVDCPECGSEIRATEGRCERCGLTLRKYKSYRIDPKKSHKRKLPATIPWWGLPLAITILVIFVAAVLSYYFFPSLWVGHKSFRHPNPYPIDLNHDGKPDCWISYDRSGKPCQIRFDTNKDGQVDRIEFLNDEGKPNKIYMDLTKDGRPQMIVTVKNEVPRLAWRPNANDKDRPAQIIQYSLSGFPMIVIDDTNNDGAFDLYRHYNQSGKIISIGRDPNKKGFPTEIRQFNQFGKLILKQIDENGDGCPETIDHYNMKGQLIERDFDTNADCLPDRIEYFRASGTKRLVSIDTNFDGIMDKFESYSEEGKFAKTGFDTDGDAKPDIWE